MAYQGQPHPPSNFRPPGQFPAGQRPQPQPGFRPPGAPGPGGPGPMHMQPPPKIVQQSSRIRDITPQKILTEADCRQKLTEYSAFSIRKVAPQSPKETASWARAEVTDDHLDQAEIKKTIKKLDGKGKTVAEKMQALAQYQQGQVTALLDDLASKETDRNFEWSLVQIDRVEKGIPGYKSSGKKKFETSVMNLYVKRAPVPGLNAVMMFQNIEKRRLDLLRAPPPPQMQQPPPPAFPPPPGFRPGSAHSMRPPSREQEPAFVEISKGHLKSPRSKHKERRYHERDSSSTGSSDSYNSASDSESDAGSSLGTSISSRSEHHRRRNKRTTRSHSKHRPKYIVEQHRMSPEPRPSDAYGVPHHAGNPYPQQQHQLQHQENPQHFRQPQHPQIHQQNPPPQRPAFPAAPDVPRMVPAMDPITSAYQAGREDARAERGERAQSPAQPQVIIERIIERPHVERVIESPPIEHIIESPRRIVSYARLPERPRLNEPRYNEDRYVDDFRSQDDEYIIRRRDADDHAILREQRLRRDAEEYIDRRPLDRPEFIGRRPSYSVRGDSSPSLSPVRDSFDRRPDIRDRGYRRPSISRVLPAVTPHPFAQVPRRYPPSTVSSGYGRDPGW